MRLRTFATLLPAVTLTFGALPAAPAAAHTHEAVYDAARTVLRTAARTLDSVCAAVADADALLGGVTPAGTADTAAVACPEHAHHLIRTIDAALPAPPSRDPVYIVVLKPTAKVVLDPGPIGRDLVRPVEADTDPMDTPDAAALAAWQAGAQVKHIYRHALRGYAAQMSAATLATVSADPKVDYVEQDAWFQPDVRQPNPPWGLDRIDQRTLPMDANYYYNQTGAGVKAYVIDSGIYYGHADFGGRAVPGADFSPSPNNGLDCSTGINAGHGTHVAGTIGGATHGVAKAVTLVSVRVFPCSGGIGTNTIVAAVDWVTNDHQPGQRAVANMSLGGPVSAALDQAVVNSINDGVAYSVSAGNSNSDACNQSPARVPAAMTIAASTSTDQRWPNSNWGGCVDWFAPGDQITSAGVASPTATAVKSGTSMAAPHNSGVAALYLEAYPTASPAQVSSAIDQWTTKNVIGGANGAPPHLLHVATPLHIGVGGTIVITRTTGSPTFTTTGVFATSEYNCALSGPLVEVVCVANYNPDIVWECIHFLLTAQAPAPNTTGSGQVSAKVTCDSGQTTSSGDVNGIGAAGGDNWVSGEQLGSAYVVRCRAAGINGGSYPTGSYQVTCNEPSARYPYGA